VHKVLSDISEKPKWIWTAKHNDATTIDKTVYCRGNINKPDMETKAPTEPAAETVEVTEPETTEPTEPVVDTAEATEPEVETTEPTEPVVDTAEATEPEDKTTEPTDPVVETTEATVPEAKTTEPTEPVVEPATKATEATEPASDEPDMLGEEVDDDYFATLTADAPEPTPIPKPLGVESGVISSEQITASTYYSIHTAEQARGNSKNSWQPTPDDSKPWIRIDLGKVMEVHGLGTKGDYSQNAWTTKYTVYTSEDGVTYTPLLNTHTGRPRIFLGNSDQDTWKNHCLHRYYGCPPKMRYVEFRPLENNGNGFAMRVELYGFRDADDPALLRVLEKDVWTRSTTGCQCSFNPMRFDCACCYEGASQCPCDNSHQCVKSGLQTTKCGIPELRDETEVQDPWTLAETGELCQFDPSRGNTCAKCAVGGCQCPRNPNQCVECGHMEACGKKESVFGINSYCDVTETCVAKIRAGGN
jgi:hypothetical protein